MRTGAAENYFARKTNEEYLAKKNSPLGDGVSEEEIKQYQELVDKWTKEREEKFPSKDFGLKYIFPDKYPGGDKLPTKDWLRSNDFYKNDFEAIKKAWITHCNINMEDYE